MRESKVHDDKGVVNDVEGVRHLDGREMLSCMREDISLCVLVVVLMVALAVEVLMVLVGVVVLMIVVGAVCLGAVEVDCSGVVDTFVLDGVFVVVVVVEVELVVVGCVLKLVLWCSDGSGVFCNALA